MSLPVHISDRLTLPLICAPMFLISTPELVIESCKAGLIGAFPRKNTRTLAEFEGWLRQITNTLAQWSAETGLTPGPLAVNIITTLPSAELRAELELCAAYSVDIIITANGKPTEITRIAHDLGMAVYHDVISIEFAEKAIAAGVDGLNCIGAGGGGHSGTMTHIALIPKVRSIFDGVISLAGAVATGRAIRAAEVLGADLAFVGTRFAATRESSAHPLQKQWMVTGTSRDLRYSPKINGVSANWMLESLAHNGLDLDALPEPVGRGHDHLPNGVAPWRELWSAGQGIELIHDIPSVAEAVERLADGYLAACATPDRAARVRRLAPRA